MVVALFFVHPLPSRVRHIIKRPYHAAELLIEIQRLCINDIVCLHIYKLIFHHAKRFLLLTAFLTILKHQIELILPETHQLRILFPDYDFQLLRFLNCFFGYLGIFSILLNQLIQLFILIFKFKHIVLQLLVVITQIFKL